jgi:hypothetical protein
MPEIMSQQVIEANSTGASTIEVSSISSKTINLVIGLIAISLASGLGVAGMFEFPIEPSCRKEVLSYAISISHYYCWSSLTRNLFVGGLTGLAMLFLAYRGWARTSKTWDRMIACTCTVCAVCIANFPTNSEAKWITHVHFWSVVVLFVTLSYIAWYRFQDHNYDAEARIDEQIFKRWKQVRNGIYRLCAAVMLLAMIFIGVGKFIEWRLPDAQVVWPHYVFWGEAVALTGFGFAWLTKSRFLFAYQSDAWRILYLRRSWHESTIAKWVSKLSR